MRRISVFGATGSIGQSTLDLLGRAPDAFGVVALTGGRNIAALAAAARAHRAEVAVTAYPECLQDLRAALAGSATEAAAGPEAIAEAAERPADLAVSAIVGAAGLVPGLRPAAQGTTIVNRMFERGFLLNFAGGVALRLAPPLVVSRAEIDTMVNALGEVLAEL